MRGMQLSTICPMCKCGRETTLQVLWGCRQLRVIQDSWGPGQGSCNDIKINIDAVIDKVSKIVGIGIIIRDYMGIVVASSIQRISATYDPHVAEAITLCMGLVFAMYIGSDAKVVVDWLNSGKALDSDVGLSFLKM
ncbi:hypothetical protein Ddye_000463 [Dipteronia dyeriana]|uniref:RNase H type-1 domain-containing protein n=1 Tax=Dipteronia dyeriana TaxID=168575 RepID=A0AAD9XLS4_9ROSI|nr:hypothetical protein Ddye_000463 [Dipteronia dyeriana]